MSFANFGQRLRAARTAEQLSLRRLSEQTGISYSQISRLERQKHAPRAQDAERLAAALGTTFSALTTGQIDPQTAPLPLVPGAEQELVASYPLTRITRLVVGRTMNLSRIARASPSWTAIVVRGKVRLRGPALDTVISAGARLTRKVLTRHTVRAEALQETELLWIEEPGAVELHRNILASRLGAHADLAIGYVCAASDAAADESAADELRAAGCSLVFQDQVAKASLARPQLIAAIERLLPGSTFLAPSLPALGLRTHEVLELVTGLERLGARFQTLDGSLDTRRPGTTDLIGALALLEPNPRSSRVSAGTRAARAGRKSLGRPAALTGAQIEEMRTLVAQGLSTGEIRGRLGYTKSTVERYVRRIREGVL